MNAVGIDVSKGKSMVAIMQWIRLLRMLRLWHIWVSMVHLIFFTFDFPVCTYRVLILFAFLYILMYICAWFTALVCQKHKFIFLLVVGIYTISCCTGNFLPFQRIAAFSTLTFVFRLYDGPGSFDCAVNDVKPLEYIFPETLVHALTL